MSAKPSTDDMRLAAEWLGEYEDSPEGDACKRVAAWLIEQADAKELRDAAREHGVPVKALRRKVAERRDEHGYPADGWHMPHNTTQEFGEPESDESSSNTGANK